MSVSRRHLERVTVSLHLCLCCSQMELESGLQDACDARKAETLEVVSLCVIHVRRLREGRSAMSFAHHACCCFCCEGTCTHLMIDKLLSAPWWVGQLLS